MVGFQWINVGAYGLMYVTWITFGIVVLTLIPEKFFGKYRSPTDKT